MSKNKPKVWVLIRRYEWEDQGNQTEYCDTFVFAKKESALAKARSLVRSDLKKYGDGTKAVATKEIMNMEWEFEGKFPRHLVQLTDSDNVVYELYRRTIG